MGPEASLISLYCWLYGHAPDPIKGSTLVPDPIKDDIAVSVSLRTETVSRKLREMEKDGLIERLGHARIRVLDRDALRDIYVSQ